MEEPDKATSVSSSETELVAKTASAELPTYSVIETESNKVDNLPEENKNPLEMENKFDTTSETISTSQSSLESPISTPVSTEKNQSTSSELGGNSSQKRGRKPKEWVSSNNSKSPSFKSSKKSSLVMVKKLDKTGMKSHSQKEPKTKKNAGAGSSSPSKKSGNKNTKIIPISSTVLGSMIGSISVTVINCFQFISIK